MNAPDIRLFDSLKYLKCGTRLKNSPSKSTPTRWLLSASMMRKFDVSAPSGKRNVPVNALFETSKISSDRSEKSSFGKSPVKRFELTSKVSISRKSATDGSSEPVSAFPANRKCFKCRNLDSDSTGTTPLNEFSPRSNTRSDFI